MATFNRMMRMRHIRVRASHRLAACAPRRRWLILISDDCYQEIDVLVSLRWDKQLF